MGGAWPTDQRAQSDLDMVVLGRSTATALWAVRAIALGSRWRRARALRAVPEERPATEAARAVATLAVASPMVEEPEDSDHVLHRLSRL